MSRFTSVIPPRERSPFSLPSKSVETSDLNEAKGRKFPPTAGIAATGKYCQSESAALADTYFRRNNIAAEFTPWGKEHCGPPMSGRILRQTLIPRGDDSPVLARHGPPGLIFLTPIAREAIRRLPQLRLDHGKALAERVVENEPGDVLGRGIHVDQIHRLAQLLQ
jgi:hypothetical protein